MIKENFKLIDNTDNKKAFNENAKKFIEAKQYVDEYTPIKNDAYKELQRVIKAEFNLDDIESQGKYQTLEYSIEFKKAYETDEIDKELLKTKYPEVYAEVTKKKFNKPAFLKIEKIVI